MKQTEKVLDSEIRSIASTIFTIYNTDSCKRRIPIRIQEFIRSVNTDIELVDSAKNTDDDDRRKALLNKFIYIWDRIRNHITSANTYKTDMVAKTVVEKMDDLSERSKAALKFISGSDLELTAGSVIIEEGFSTIGETVKYFNKHFRHRFNAKELADIASNFHCV